MYISDIAQSNPQHLFSYSMNSNKFPEDRAEAKLTNLYRIAETVKNRIKI